MKKKALSMIFVSACFLFGCDSGCQATTLNVGRVDVPIVLIDTNGGPDTVVISDANGDITIPCGQQVGQGQVN